MKTTHVYSREFLESKKVSKFAKEFGNEYVNDFLQKTTEELKEVISRNTVTIADLKAETESLPAYVNAKETLKDLNGGLKDSTKPLKMAVDLATALLQEQNRDDSEDGVESVEMTFTGLSSEVKTIKLSKKA